MKRERQTNQIRKFIIDAIANGDSKITNLAAKEFGISRQAVNRHLNTMIDEGILTAEGATRNKVYSLKPFVSEKFEFDMTDESLKNRMNGLYDENKVWLKKVYPLLKDLPKNILEICQYGFSEMLNNVFDHSEATKVRFGIKHDAAQVVLFVIDNGVGIFNKIQKELSLDDHLHAILELAKGKLTTDPEHHTGEGIFFTSRMFDDFFIESGTLRFVHFKAGEDWLLEKPDTRTDGTEIRMDINLNSNRTTKEVFDKFSTELEEYGFTRTKVPVSLVRYGDENLISRSQAKRLLSRFDRFKEVILDFTNVDSIGPAFADEIFRVFAKEHPNIELLFVNANNDVKKMIHRALNYET